MKHYQMIRSKLFICLLRPGYGQEMVLPGKGTVGGRNGAKRNAVGTVTCLISMEERHFKKKGKIPSSGARGPFSC